MFILPSILPTCWVPLKHTVDFPSTNVGHECGTKVLKLSTKVTNLGTIISRYIRGLTALMSMPVHSEFKSKTSIRKNQWSRWGYVVNYTSFLVVPELWSTELLENSLRNSKLNCKLSCSLSLLGIPLYMEFLVDGKPAHRSGTETGWTFKVLSSPNTSTILISAVVKSVKFCWSTYIRARSQRLLL